MSLTVLVGPPGALVSQCAAELSARLSRPCASVEEAIEAIDGRSASGIVIESGIEALRSLEASVVGGFLNGLRAEEDKILALGSLSLGDGADDELFAPARASLAGLREAGTFVAHLTGDLATLVRRTGLDGPRFASVASPRRILLGQLPARERLYRSLADVTIDTSGLSVSEATDLLEENLPQIP
ncbi:MAG: shikimate kinase [Actinomycetaceae bacterium]|nr:shikimate kinase [Actinomycetaceae bacterium]